MKVAEPGQTARGRPGPGRGRPRRARTRRPHPGGRERRLAGRDRVDAIRALDRAAGGLEYVEQPCATVEGLAEVRRRVDVPGRRRRVDPSSGGPAAGRRARGRRHRGPQGAAARRGTRLPAHRRADRPARRRVLRPRDVGRDRDGRRAGRCAARAALRLRAGHRAAARRQTSSPSRCCPVDGAPRGASRWHPTLRGWPQLGPPPTTQDALVGQDHLRGCPGARRVNPSTALGRVLVDELVRGGVREAVLAPGLAIGTPGAAPCTPPTRQARCGCTCASTSGRRASSRSGWRRRPAHPCRWSRPAAPPPPTCTRPSSRRPSPASPSWSSPPTAPRSCGPPARTRAIDQLGLYGRSRPALPRGRRARRATRPHRLRPRAHGPSPLAAARGTLTHDPGPVHLNLAFREPLVPTDADDDWARAAGRVARRRGPGPLSRGPSIAVGRVGRRLAGADPRRRGGRSARTGADRPYGWPRRGVGRCSPSPAATRVPDRTRSPSGTCCSMPPTYPHLRPERVLVVGRPTLDRRVAALLADPVGRRRRRRAPSRAGRTPAARRRRVLAAMPEPRSTTDRSTGPGSRSWRAADAAAVEAAAGATGWTGPAVAAAVQPRWPRRRCSWWARRSRRATSGTPSPREGVTVLANRGAAGIDGTVSTAIGAALAWQAGGGGPAAALLGDLTFLHDANGLLLGPDEAAPAARDRRREQRRRRDLRAARAGSPGHAAAFERVFGTPTGADLAALCGASQTPYARVSTVEDLVARRQRPAREQLQVIEVRVPRPSGLTGRSVRLSDRS